MKDTTRSVLTLFVLLLAWCLPPSAARAEPVALDDLTRLDAPAVDVALGSPFYNRRTGIRSYLVTVSNTSDGPLAAPIYLAIEDLTSATVTVVNADEVSIDPVARPYFVLGSGELLAGEGLAVRVELDAGRQRFGFRPVAYHQPASGDTVAPGVVITSPETLALFGQADILVEGTVDDPQATVMVNGMQADVTAGDPSTFSAPATLSEGNNLISATATDAAGNVASATVRVTLDTDPPTVRVETPEPGSVVTARQVDVAGLVNDIVTGTTINGDDCTVTVNGVEAQVANRTWVVPGLLLTGGENTLVVEARDRAGNRSATQVRVTVQDRVGQRLVMVSGNSQEAPINSPLADPLVVALEDANGDPVPGKTVRFAVVRGDGEVNAFPAAGTSVEVESDDNGVAQVLFTLGKRSGAGNQRVRASAAGFVGQLDFCATGLTGDAAEITALAGDRQTGVAEQVLPLPLLVLVTDVGGNPVGGVDVTFEVTSGGGNLDGADRVTLATDLDGLAQVAFTLGPQQGQGNNTVTATFPGLVGDPVTFTATGLVPAAAADTTVSGVVLDNQNLPVEGVQVEIEDTDPLLSAVTDAAGQFLIEDAPVGAIRLKVIGATTTRPGEWPTLEFDLTSVAGQDNTVGMPIFLLPLDMESSRLAGGDEDVTLTMAEIPGAELTVFANSVTCPNGDRQCVISFTQVNGEKVPMEPPLGSAFMLAWTVQPSGTHFDPPARICIPSMDQPPGEQVEMFSFDHDLGEFVAVGTATVTEDGSQLCADPGYGIVKAGWGGCVPPPPPRKCLLSCNDRNECTSDSLVNPPCRCSFTPTNEGGQCGGGPGANACVEGVCQGGACVGQQKPEGTSCDDGVFCTENDRCQGGGCKGDAIEDRDLGTVEVDVNIEPLLSGIRAFGNLLTAGGLLEDFDLTFSESGNLKKTCCEQKQQKDVDIRKVEWGVNLKLETGKLFVPSLSFDIRAVSIGVFVSLGVAGQVKLSGENNQCTDNVCWGGTVGVGGGASGGVAAQDAAKIVALSGSLGSGLKVEGTVDCKQIGYQVAHDGLKGQVSLELFDGFIAVNYQVELIAGGPIDGGSIPLGEP